MLVISYEGYGSAISFVIHDGGIECYLAHRIRQAATAYGHAGQVGFAIARAKFHGIERALAGLDGIVCNSVWLEAMLPG